MYFKLNEKNWALFLLFWAVTISALDPEDPASIFSDVKMQSLPHLLFGERDYGVLKARKAKYQEERKNISLLPYPLPFNYT